ncbi:MAG: exodeoxyribonuclease VII small subunit [Piscirickettsiaceae bacterium]|nr:exodeoxyribonuclease VII small subunit [Piscirickettsiaceae bacterium]
MITGIICKLHFLFRDCYVAKRKKLDYEASVNELESLVNQLEQGDISLEESLKLYENGVLLTRDCQQSLQAAEQKVQMLLKQSGQDKLVDFDQKNTDS